MLELRKMGQSVCASYRQRETERMYRFKDSLGPTFRNDSNPFLLTFWA